MDAKRIAELRENFATLGWYSWSEARDAAFEILDALTTERAAREKAEKERDDIRLVLASTDLRSLPHDYSTVQMAIDRMERIKDLTLQGLAEIGRAEAAEALAARLTKVLEPFSAFAGQVIDRKFSPSAIVAGLGENRLFASDFLDAREALSATPPGEALQAYVVADLPISSETQAALDELRNASQPSSTLSNIIVGDSSPDRTIAGELGPLNVLSQECHAANQHWWHHPETGERLERNKGELLCLIHSEISECMEGERKSLMDDKLPHRRMAEVELADTLIRIFDYAGAFGYDLDGAVAEKRAFNAQRADHKAEARLSAEGKKW